VAVALGLAVVLLAMGAVLFFGDLADLAEDSDMMKEYLESGADLAPDEARRFLDHHWRKEYRSCRAILDAALARARSEEERRENS
jgi:hypothetical protein